MARFSPALAECKCLQIRLDGRGAASTFRFESHLIQGCACFLVPQQRFWQTFGDQAEPQFAAIEPLPVKTCPTDHIRLVERRDECMSGTVVPSRYRQAIARQCRAPVSAARTETPTRLKRMAGCRPGAGMTQLPSVSATMRGRRRVVYEVTWAHERTVVAAALSPLALPATAPVLSCSRMI